MREVIHPAWLCRRETAHRRWRALPHRLMLAHMSRFCSRAETLPAITPAAAINIPIRRHKRCIVRATSLLAAERRAVAS